jgi:hypothetical protein
MRALVRTLFERPLSASLLDSYLRCPVRFFLQRLFRLAPEEELNEGDDPVAVGNLMHQVLSEVYGRYEAGAGLPGGEELVAALGGELTEALYASPDFAALGRSLPADLVAMLGCAGTFRLNNYLERQPPSTILALEYPLAASFVHNSLTCALTGKADRLDLRLFPADPLPDGKDGIPDQAGAKGAARRKNTTRGKGAACGEPGVENLPGIIILDYKTGTLPFVFPSLWEEQDLWQRMQQWRPGPAGAPDDAFLLRDLSLRMESVQLPMYLLMLSLTPETSLLPGILPAKNRRIPVLDAAWIALGEDGEEKTLFPKHFSVSRRVQIIESMIPDLLHFLLRHMLENHEALPHPGKHCDWCSCVNLCMMAAPRE